MFWMIFLSLFLKNLLFRYQLCFFFTIVSEFWDGKVVNGFQLYCFSAVSSCNLTYALDNWKARNTVFILDKTRSSWHRNVEIWMLLCRICINNFVGLLKVLTVLMIKFLHFYWGFFFLCVLNMWSSLQCLWIYFIHKFELFIESSHLL